MAIFKDNSPHQQTEHITKTKRKQNNLGTRSRTTGDPDAGNFRKRMDYLRVVFMELSARTIMPGLVDLGRQSYFSLIGVRRN